MRVYIREHAICCDNALIAQLDLPFKGVYAVACRRDTPIESYPRIGDMLLRHKCKSFSLPLSSNNNLQLRFIRKYAQDHICHGIYKTNKTLSPRARKRIISQTVPNHTQPGNDLADPQVAVNYYIRRIFDYVATRYDKISFLLSDYGFIGSELNIDYKNGCPTSVPLSQLYNLKDTKVEHTNFYDKFSELGLDRYVGCEGMVVSWMNPHFSCWVSNELKRYEIYALPVVIFVI